MPYSMKIEHNNLYTHFIFYTLNKIPLITEVNRVKIEKHITDIVKINNSTLYAIYANPQHVHFIVCKDPGISDEGLATAVAFNSEHFINRNQLCWEYFKWQESCSAFSVSKADVDKVCQYINNQPNHHKKISYSEEYETFLKFYHKTIYPKQGTYNSI